MFARKNRQKERGSIEVVILVVVVAAIVGLVAWRIAETQKTQIDTEAAIENTDITPAPSSDVTVASLGMKFTVPGGHGRVTLTNQQGGELPSAELVSSKLKEAEYTCDGENTGVFGTLGVADTSAGAPLPTYSRDDLNNKTYGFTSTLEQNCYSDELMTAFRETVPKEIIRSLEVVKNQ